MRSDAWDFWKMVCGKDSHFNRFGKIVFALPTAVLTLVLFVFELLFVKRKVNDGKSGS